MQLQKSPEQYQKIPKIPKSAVVQHKIGVRMIDKIGVRKIELNIICKINWNSSFHTFSYFSENP